MSKKSEAEKKARAAVDRIQLLLGRRQRGDVLIGDELVRVRVVGYGKLARMNGDDEVCPFGAQPVPPAPKADFADLEDLQHPKETKPDPVDQSAQINACYGHMPDPIELSRIAAE